MTSSFTASGEVADYTDARKESIKQVFATAAGVDPSAVTVEVTAGSVVITVTISSPTQDAATAVSNSLSSGILANAAALETVLTNGGVAGVTISVGGVQLPLISAISAAPTIADTQAAPADDNTSYLVIIIVLAVVAAIATAVATWALNNKVHARPIFHPVFSNLETKKPKESEGAEMASPGRTTV